MPVALIVLLLIGAAILLQQSQGPTMTDNQSNAEALQMSDMGRALLIQHEGIRYTPYQDSAGFWTVGVGHLIVPGDGLTRDQSLSEEQVMQLFRADLAKAEAAVKKNVRVPLTQGQYDALVDWTYQYGSARLAGSTLLELINNSQYDQAVQEFPKWIYAGKPAQIVDGLIKRRQDNVNLFLA